MELTKQYEKPEKSVSICGVCRLANQRKNAASPNAMGPTRMTPPTKVAPAAAMISA